MKREVLLLAVGLCAGIIGVVAIRTWQHAGARDATAAGATRAVQGPADPVSTVTPETPSGEGPLDPTTLAEFGIHFVARAVANGAPPTLPNGQQGVAKDQAIRAAMDTGLAGVDQAHNLLPNVQVSAQYGLFTRGRPGMQILAYSQNRPAWIVTFSGPGVAFYGSGGPPRPGPRPPREPKHEVSVVIDAATGHYLMGFA
jgi:hypothetical protein